VSLVICKVTGIVQQIDDGLMEDGMDSLILFNLTHPLANYNQVVKTFKYKTHTGKSELMGKLLAGSILTVLKHYDMLRVHSEEEALWANTSMVQQAKGNTQLLALLHKLLKQEERLDRIKTGYKKRDDKETRHFKFCLEACMEQGSEYRNENKYFLANLQQWISELLPPTVEELIAIDNASREQASKNLSANHVQELQGISVLELADGTIVEYDDVVEAVKNKLQDDIARKSKRIEATQLRKKLNRMIKLMREPHYNVFTIAQADKLRSMIEREDFKPVILNKAIQMLESKGMKLDSSEQVKRNKLFETAGWLRAADVEFKRREYALKAFGDVLDADLNKVVNGDRTELPNESLVERLARLSKSNSTGA